MSDKNLANSVVVLDRERLDEEWVAQAERYANASRELADARLAQNEAKARLDLKEAELSLDIRGSPETYHLPKVTDAVVDASVRVQPEYQQALKLYNKARHRVDLLDGLVTALDHKKKALESLVFLQNAGYFGQPKEQGTNGGMARMERDRALGKKNR